jgi:hypothetical protein
MGFIGGGGRTARGQTGLTAGNGIRGGGKVNQPIDSSVLRGEITAKRRARLKRPAGSARMDPTAVEPGIPATV